MSNSSIKRKNLAQTLGYYGSFFVLGAVLASLGPTLPALAEKTGVNISRAGLLFSTRSLGYLSGSLLAGVLYDAFKGHRVLTFFLTLTALLLVFIPETAVFLLLVGIIFFLGLSQGGIDVGANTLLTDIHQRHSGAYLSGMYFVAGLGSFLTPLFLGQFSLQWGYRGLMVPAGIVALWLVAAPSPGKVGGETSTTKEPISFRVLIPFALLSFLIVGIEVSYGGWIFTYFRDNQFGSEQLGYTLTSIFWLSITAGRLLSIPAAVKIKPRPMIYAYLLGGAVSAGLMIAFSSQSWAVWGGTVGLGLSLSAVFPTTFTFVKQKIHIRGKSTGLVWSIGSLGAVTLPWLIGQAMVKFASVWMMIIILGGWLLGLLLVVILMRVLRKGFPE